jgi:hypothetical protein
MSQEMFYQEKGNDGSRDKKADHFHPVAYFFSFFFGHSEFFEDFSRTQEGSKHAPPHTT